MIGDLVPQCAGLQFSELLQELGLFSLRVHRIPCINTLPKVAAAKDRNCDSSFRA